MRRKPASLCVRLALVAALCGGGVYLFTVSRAGRKPPPGITPLASRGQTIDGVPRQRGQDASDSHEGGLSTEQREKLVSKFAVLAEECLKAHEILREEKATAIAQGPNPYLVAEGGRHYGAEIWARMEDYRRRKPETIGASYRINHSR